MGRISALMARTPIPEAPARKENGAVSGSRRYLVPLSWILLGALVLATDHAWASGHPIQFPVALIIPVVLAARFSGPWWGIGLAFVLPLARFLIVDSANASLTAAEAAACATVRIDILAIIVIAVAGEVQRRNLLRELESLKGSLNVCTSCRNVRGPEGIWMPAEEYVATCTEKIFQHDTCPECMRAYLGHLIAVDMQSRKKDPEEEAAMAPFVAPAWDVEADRYARAWAEARVCRGGAGNPAGCSVAGREPIPAGFSPCPGHGPAAAFPAGPALHGIASAPPLP
jgi:hypothetical protein